MKAALPLFMLFLATALVFPAQVTYNSPLASVESLLNGVSLPSLSSLQALLGNPSTIKQVVSAAGSAASGNPSGIEGIAGAALGVASGNLSGIAGIAGATGITNIIPAPPPIIIPASQLRLFAALAVVFFYVFAAGKIADFLQSSGKKITKREALYAPFALMLVSGVFIAAYFLSGAYRPPQDTLITNIVYLVLIPAGITLAIGSAVLWIFFRDRLNFLQSLDLSAHIVLSPIFDGLKGYWTALGAVLILGIMSVLVFFSTGGRLALATFDFLLLSILVSLYFLYKMLTKPGNENRASNAVMILCLLAPSLMQKYFKDLVCAILVRLPFGIFQTCPLDSVGSDVTLAISIGATMLLLVPVVPLLYAFVVNLMRAFTLANLLLAPEPKPAPKGGDEESGEGMARAGADDAAPGKWSGGGEGRIITVSGNAPSQDGSKPSGEAADAWQESSGDEAQPSGGGKGVETAEAAAQPEEDAEETIGDDRAGAGTGAKDGGESSKADDATGDGGKAAGKGAKAGKGRRKKGAATRPGVKTAAKKRE